ncbi:hypothetical protein [Piscinibacter sp.]|jgi:hypothetical protein|uniref:hypothetical protein n=1 Tax=Piscinibacter sp. TaxID=1903157 RepID=UPI0035594994
MDQTSTDDTTAMLSSPFLWPFAAARNWASLFNLAPQTLTQPINPGWTLGNVINVTENNSSAPDTEREIVSRHSYGRQLGRIMEVLLVVLDSGAVDKRKLSAADQQRVSNLRALAHDIDELKSREAIKRVERIVTDLAYLKDRHPKVYARAQQLLEQGGAG